MEFEKEIENILELSNLYIEEKDFPKVIRDIRQMMDFAQVVADYDGQVAAENQKVCKETPMREDVAASSSKLQDVLCNASLTEDDYFLLRKSEKNGQNP